MIQETPKTNPNAPGIDFQQLHVRNLLKNKMECTQLIDLDELKWMESTRKIFGLDNG